MAANNSADNIIVGNIDHSQGVAIGTGATAIVGYTADQVSVLIEQIRTTFQPKPFDDRSPYVGLAAYQETDADRFFGREKLIAEIIARMGALRSRAIFVAGPSGSGKSSLLRAGVIPALKAGKIAKSETWLYETLQPSRTPLDELTRVVVRWSNSIKAGDEFRSSTNDATMLHRWVDVSLGDAPDRRAVLLVDQFEEVFTQVSQEADRLAFLNLLSYAATVEKGRVIILFSLRSDFLAHCAVYPELNALLNQQFLQVGAMSPDELVSAMAQPALRVGLRIDPDLIAQIVNEMRDAPAELPLMQFALDDLFQAERAKGGVIALTLQDYLARGGLFQALERHADNAFKQLNENEQKLARVIFSGVIEIRRGTNDTRRIAWFDELVPAGETPASVEAVVDKLADARLVTTDERDGKHTVTLAHDRLIDAWQWLRQLVNETREAIAIQNQIAEATREWEQNKRDAGYFYTGARIAQAVEWKAKNAFRLNQSERDFIEASRAAQQRELEQQAERKQYRYMRQAFGGATGTGIGYGLAFALAVWFNNPKSGELAPIIFLPLVQVGGFVGFSIGLCLWLTRASQRDQIISSSLVGMIVGGITFVLYLISATPGGYNLLHVLAGAVLGASLGASASFPMQRLIRLATFTLAGLLAAELVAIFTGAISPNLFIVAIFGLILGGSAGLGFYLSAVNTENHIEE